MNGTNEPTKKERLRRLELAKEYIDENFLTIGEIKEVAEHCNLSIYHFYRSFKIAYDLTPYQYIVEKKMKLAKIMLEDQSMTLTAIADKCRFPDFFTFSKAFKRYYGLSPSSMR
jgi:AraC-like DNA-binding protein